MPEVAQLLPMLAFLLAIGAFAGVMAGLLGVGGGVILVPAFLFAFKSLGYDHPQLMQLCLATSLATIIVTSVRSVLAHNRKGAVDWAILRGWAPGIALGALLGVALAAQLRSAQLQILFGAVGLFIGAYLALGRTEWRLAAAMPTGLWRAALSPVVGFLSTLMGIGGGSFGVPLMTLSGVQIHRAVATAAGFGVLIAVPSVMGFLTLQLEAAQRPPLTFGAVNIPAFLVIVAMTIFTAPLGARLAHATDPRRLKQIFGLFLLVVAANMLRKGLVG